MTGDWFTSAPSSFTLYSDLPPVPWLNFHCTQIHLPSGMAVLESLPSSGGSTTSSNFPYMPPQDQMFPAPLLDCTMSQCEGLGGVLATNIITRPYCSAKGNCLVNTSWFLPPGLK